VSNSPSITPPTPRERLRGHRGKIVLLLAAAVVAAWLAYTHRGDLSRETIVAYGKELPAGWFMAGFLVLPLTGFPFTVFLVLAGIRFGLGGGMATTAVAVIFHHFAAFRIAHGWFRDPVRRRLEHAGYAIPPIRAKHRAWFTALFAALHGPPYIAKLYLLALTDIPFRTYFWVGAPVYILFCLIPVGAGTALKHFNPTWIYLIIGISTVLLLAGFWLRRRLAGGSPEDPPQT
jgi:uncharacterized membrane protein YdjX (TVP38/TMEM64 family)